MTHEGFYSLGIAPGILDIITKLGFERPTPIQEQSIPLAVEGHDLVGIAQTGTGKTLAFGIPLIQHILQTRSLGLIVVPTRELALQVNQALGTFALPLGIRTATLIGGQAISHQLHQMKQNASVVIATPGRLIDHIEQKTLSLGKISVLVLDEADRMLDMGFAPQLRRILAVLPKERQTMLFSATMPEEIVSMAQSYLKCPIRVEIARSGSTAQNATQELFFVAQDEKSRLLEKVLCEYRGSVLVFARTKHSAQRITRGVRAIGLTAAELHSNRSLMQRREALEGFKSGKYRVLVATDIASRGIDVSNIKLVINYDLPNTVEGYVHRIGRTARAGESGHAISFARPNEASDVRAIERFIRITLPISKLPKLPPARIVPLASSEQEHGGRGRGRASRPAQSRKESGRRSAGINRTPQGNSSFKKKPRNPKRP